MIVLNELGAYKKYVYNKHGVEPPKGGAYQYSKSPYYDTILDNELKIKNMKDSFIDGEYEPRTKNSSLHYSINMRSSKHPERNLRKNALMKMYGQINS